MTTNRLQALNLICESYNLSGSVAASSDPRIAALGRQIHRSTGKLVRELAVETEVIQLDIPVAEWIFEAPAMVESQLVEAARAKAKRVHDNKPKKRLREIAVQGWERVRDEAERPFIRFKIEMQWGLELA